MDYPILLTTLQYAALAAMAACAISTLRLMTIQFTLRDWSDEARKNFSTAAAAQAFALLAYAFASGGVLALHFFQTSDLPPLPVLLFRFAVLCVLSASVVFMVAIARPWLLELSDGPLPVNLSLNRLTALTFAFAGFAAALITQVLTAWVPPTDLNVGHMALMTLLFWLVLALPSLTLGVVARFMGGEPARETASFESEEMAFAEVEYTPRRAIPQLSELQPEQQSPHQMVHVPARRAPRPSLATPEEIGIGYAVA